MANRRNRSPSTAQKPIGTWTPIFMGLEQTAARVRLQPPGSRIRCADKLARTRSADSLSHLIQFVVPIDLIVFFDCTEDLLFFVRVGNSRGRYGSRRIEKAGSL